jgi:hypothetical protein
MVSTVSLHELQALAARPLSRGALGGSAQNHRGYATYRRALYSANALEPIDYVVHLAYGHHVDFSMNAQIYMCPITCWRRVTSAGARTHQ